MAKVRKNFKLSPEALLSLVRLSGLWGCDQTAVVERLLREADPSEMDRDERESTAASLAEGTRSRVTEAIQPACMPNVQPSTGGMKRVTPIPVPDWVAKDRQKSGNTLTGRPHGPVPKGGKK